MTMTPTSYTYQTPTGGFTVDRSKIPAGDLATLDRLAPQGVLDGADLVELIQQHPQVFLDMFGASNALDKPGEGKDEELEYDAMDQDVMAVVAHLQKLLSKTMQQRRANEMRETVNESNLIMVEAKKEFEKDLSAARRNFNSGVASAVGEGVGGGLQLGGAYKSTKQLANANKASKSAGQAHRGIEQVNAAKHDGVNAMKAHNDKIDARAEVKMVRARHEEEAKAADRDIDTLKESQTQAKTRKDAEVHATENEIAELKNQRHAKFEEIRNVEGQRNQPGLAQKRAEFADIDRNVEVAEAKLARQKAEGLQEDGNFENAIAAKHLQKLQAQERAAGAATPGADGWDEAVAAAPNNVEYHKAQAEDMTAKISALEAEKAGVGPNNFFNRNRLENEISSAKRTKAQAEQNVAREQAKVDSAKPVSQEDVDAFERDMSTKIDRLKHGGEQGMADADQLTKKSMVTGQVFQGLSQIMGSLFKIGAGSETLAAGEDSANAKMAHARGEFHTLMYQQHLDTANTARDAITDMRSSVKAVNESTQQTASNIVRNMA